MLYQSAILFYLLTYSITDILPHLANYARHFFCSLYQICTTKTHILFHTNIKKCQFCDTKSQLFFAAIRGSGSNWLYEIRTTSALLDKGAVLKRNDCINIYAFRLVRVWGWSWRSGIIRFHDTLSLCPHTREHCFTFYRPYIRDSRI